MTDDELRSKAIEQWLNKADDALASAESELAAARHDFVVNRAYYACFYAASAILLAEGRKFVKHTGVRGALHRDLIKAGRLDAQWGKAYDRAFDLRQGADYELSKVVREDAEELLDLARGFVAEMRRLFGAEKQA